MKTLEIQELIEHINEILHSLEEGETIKLTNQGRVVAHLVPQDQSQQSNEQDARAFLATLDQIASEVSSHITGPIDAVEVVRDIRCTL